ncbi:CC0125/CC1285 family lipoprotein [Sphingomonas carotinifaciens]|uniref:DUF4136 domain-containing protein n=1 Tax=Sphingomonas carotinifaciens TaxID=1166323 RepID=A0A1G7IAG1_9SPHN|nr:MULTISPECIES: hypothetical protein [Sphingomonas]MBB4084946.1 hypothetical protein [Sphingomonas carotinifaciens]MWC44329.1 hypothetical protein [Sphingomonas carotinifaciens]SDF09727.1 hypothetical protein SAMN05216557_102172 [Sphingomonas carotinifaciens]
MQIGRKALIAALTAGTLLVAGCATETTYRPATGSGFYATGYSDRQIEPNRFLVSFAGNTVTARDTVERYLLFRAAELTLANGYDYFVMADRDTQLRSRTYSNPTAFGGGFGGFGGGLWGPMWRFHGAGFGWRSWDPFWGGPWGGGVDIRTVDRYEATAEVVMRKGPIPRDNLRAFDARAVVNSIGPTVVLPKPKR